MVRRVLLTGASGFLGTHVREYLESNTNWELVCPTDDLTKKLPELGQFDYIINLASRSSVEGSIKTPVKIIQNNVSSTLRLLEYARFHPPEVFLHLSSVEAGSPRNPYAASKASQEAIASAYQATYSVPVVIVTSNNIVGSNLPSDRFIPRVIQQVRAGETVKIYTQGGDIGSRVYNPVANVVDALVYVLALGSPDSFARYAIQGGERVTNLGMAQRIAKVIGQPLKYELVDAGNLRPGYTQQLRQSDPEIPGWQPAHSLDEGLQWI
jgi:dTDP-glucose 4,6-dehydratase